VCPRCKHVVRYIQSSPTVLLAGAIREILARPSSRTARIDPIHPAILAIPTFGIYEESSSGDLS